MYKLFIAAEFDKTLNKVATADKRIIEKKLQEYIAPQLKSEPHHGLNIKKLKGYSPETWRYRIGRYRMFYLIDDVEMIVSVIAIDQRKDAY